MPPWYPSTICAPKVLARYTSSPRVSKNLDHIGFLPKSSTGEKFHGTPDALVSYAVILPISLAKEVSQLAANPIS